MSELDGQGPEPGLPATSPGTAKAPRRLLPMLVGWVVVPLLVAASVLLSGIHLAAHDPDAWYTRAAVALGDVF